MHSRPHNQAIIHKHNYRLIQTPTPLAVSGQDEVESSEIVGGVVDDLLRVSNADVDCIHYLLCEVTPIKYLQVQKHRKKEKH